jgi:hypothetical protein
MHHNDTNIAPSALMQEGVKQIAALRGEDAANDDHIAQHIRGMVAATMSKLSADATDATRNTAEHWQQWALGVAEGMELPVAD